LEKEEIPRFVKRGHKNMKPNLKSFFILSLCLLFSLSSVLYSEQTPEQRWVARYNGSGNGIDWAYAVVNDSFGNVYITGESPGYGTSTDFATIKYDSNGNELWVSRYNGPGNKSDRAFALFIDRLGYVYVTGPSYGDGSNSDYATIKYDPNGKELWVSRYNGIGNYQDMPKDIFVDSKGNVYVTGESDANETIYDYATVKYDPNGNELWVSLYNGPGISYDCYDWASAIYVDNSGNVYVTGYSTGLGTSKDYATLKYDPNGKQLWVARYNGLGNKEDYARDLVVDDSGNVYVTGDSWGIGTYYDYATVKYDSNGNEQWVSRYDDPDHLYDQPIAVSIDDIGNVYVTGSSSGDVAKEDYATIKYDPNGKQLWLARYNGPNNGTDKATALVLDKSGNIYVTGSINISSNNHDYATIKYDSDGNQLWSVCYNGAVNGYDSAKSLAVDNSGNVYVTGLSYGGTVSDIDYVTIKYTQHDYCLNLLPSDYNKNCIVDFLDYAILAVSWLENYDYFDLDNFSQNWLDCNFALSEDCW